MTTIEDILCKRLHNLGEMAATNEKRRLTYIGEAHDIVNNYRGDWSRIRLIKHFYTSYQCYKEERNNG
jgi:hypothetical protein